MIPLLSICILTRQRAPLLADLLRSIISQRTDDFEVVISEDGQTLETQAVVTEFRPAFGKLLRFASTETPIGYDRNVLRAVELATGEYCWLMSDDDRIEEGGIAKVLEALGTTPQLAGMTTGLCAYDSNLTHKISIRSSHLANPQRFRDANEAALGLIDLIGFLSSQIVHREYWREAVNLPDLQRYCSGYVQMYLLLRVMQRHPEWQFLPGPIVGWRSGNDSFHRGKQIRRLQMEVENYETIFGDVFGRDSPTCNRVLRHISATHVRHHIVQARLNGCGFNYSRQALLLCLPRYWRYLEFWRKTLPILIIPAFLLSFLRRFIQTRRTKSEVCL